MSRLPDPTPEGLARGWRVQGGPHAALPAGVDRDLAIDGCGAGAGITAEWFAAAGLEVVIFEEGPLCSSRDFHQFESGACPALRQDSACRKTADKATGILQGRCGGGSTTVNLTGSLRTPSGTLQYSREHVALPALTEAAMLPWFERAKRRLCFGPWLAAPNDDNQCLRTGAARLGIAVAAIQRNADGGCNPGCCGMDCPTNAQPSMPVTTLPATLNRGARLLVQTRVPSRVQRLQIEAGRVQALHCVPVALNGAARAATGPRITARHVVVAGGAIDSPALLRRSDAPDPHRRLGRRTFLHPFVVSAAVFDEPIEGWRGAPQTLCSDPLLHTDVIDGSIGCELEAPPLHPVLAAATRPGFGDVRGALLRDVANTQALLAPPCDGFHPQSPGGQAGLARDGSPSLDYPSADFVMHGARRTLLSMAGIQFEAGAKRVLPVQEPAGPPQGRNPEGAARRCSREHVRPYSSWAEARAAIAASPMMPLLSCVRSAHVMGGCAMAGRADLGVVRPDAPHWPIHDLPVHDGSLSPTGIGANPQSPVFGLVNQLAIGPARRLPGRDVRLA